MRSTFALFLLLSCLPLVACAPGADAAAKNLQLLRFGPEPAPPLVPGLRYLRAAIGKGHPAYLALGYVETDERGQTEVWYSADGEVLKLRGGRIVGTAGLGVDWRDVRLPPLPAWRTLGASAFVYVRERDEMPGYLFDRRDRLALRAIATPADAALIGIDTQRLRWYAESTLAGAPLPDARFAVSGDGDAETVVYGEQCLAASLCLYWQRWPPPESGP